jgi:RNA polymerase sigma factor (sigma-70 family)
VPLTSRRRARVVASRGLVDRLANRIARLFRGLVHRDDLVSVGHEALVRAVQRYQIETGVPFEGYAEPCVFGAMMNSVAGEADHKQERRFLAQIAREHRADGTPPSSPPPSFTEDDARRRTARRAAVLVSNARAHREDHPAIDDAREVALVAMAVEDLSAEDHRIIEAIYEDGASAADIAAELGCSAPTVRRRRDRILQRIGARIRPLRRAG